MNYRVQLLTRRLQERLYQYIDAKDLNHLPPVPESDADNRPEIEKYFGITSDEIGKAPFRKVVREYCAGRTF